MFRNYCHSDEYPLMIRRQIEKVICNSKKFVIGQVEVKLYSVTDQ